MLDYYLNTIRNYNILKPVEELRYFKKLHSNITEQERKEIKTTIFKSNIRLVIFLLKNHIRDNDFMDLFQDISINIWNAIDRFDYTKGVKFSSYISYLIKKPYKRELVRIPSNIQVNLVKINRISDKFFVDNGYLPNLNMLSNISGISISEIKELQKNYNTYEYDDDDNNLLNNLSYEDRDDIDLNDLLKVLNDTEKRCLLFTYNITDEKPCLSDNYIKQISRLALIKIKKSLKI